MSTAPIRRLNTPQAARHLGLAPATLEKDRVTGLLGIPYLKLGRRVVYDIGDLDMWVSGKRRLHTSDDSNGTAADGDRRQSDRVGR